MEMDINGASEVSYIILNQGLNIFLVSQVSAKFRISYLSKILTNLVLHRLKHTL